MIGMFDSGLGGLTALKALTATFPERAFLYVGDTARSPYGNKSPKTVTDHAFQGVEFLIKAGATLIILACHTTSSVAFESITGRFDVPMVEVISPAVKQAVQVSRKLQIGVIGSTGTVESGAYETKIRAMSPEAKVYSHACPLLVPLVEAGWLKKPEARMIIKKCLHPLKVRQIDTLILGASYYPLLQQIIQTKIGKRVHLVDPSKTLAESLRTYLENHPEIDGATGAGGNLRICVSDLTAAHVRLARTILKGDCHLEKVNL